MILLLLLAALPLCGFAAEALTFVKTDGSRVSFSTAGLKVAYDDFAHAIVTNDDTTATLDLAAVDYMTFDNGQAFATGDVNGDGEVNIADINALIDIILGTTADVGTTARADVNNDGEVNIADVNVLIDIILGV